MPVIPLASANYTGVPSVEPTSSSPGPIHVDAPLSAFGGALAEGLGKLGKGMGDLGNELFSRAQAMQDLTNETNAKNANIDFMATAGMLHAKYSELQGEERVAAFPKYMSDLKDAYEQHRSSLGNPMAMQKFDGAAVSTLNRSIFNAAGAAGSAQREASLTAANSEFSMTTQQVYNDPNDEQSYQDAIQKSDKAAYSKAALSVGGATGPNVAKIQADGRNELAANRILGMVRNEPNKAYELLDKYEKSGDLFGPHDIAVRNKVESIISTTGVNVISRATLQKYMQPDGTFSKSAQDMQNEVAAQAKKLYPDIAGIDVAASAAFDRNYGQHGYVQMQDQRQRTQEVNDQIVKGVQDVHELPDTLYKRMLPSEIKRFPSDVNSYQRAEQTQTNQTQFRDLLGSYNNDNAKFMDTNLYKVQGLSKGNINFFLKLQREIAPNGDPRVSRAMNWIKGYNPAMLDDLGVTGQNKDRDASNQFIGALHEAIQSYQEANGVAPNEKVVTKEILPAINKTVTQPGFWNIGGYGTTNEVPFFKSDLPDKYREQYLKLNPQAQDTEIRQRYNRQIFDNFFKQQPSTNKIQGRVGE